MAVVFAAFSAVSASSIPPALRSERRWSNGLLGCAALALGIAACTPAWAQVSGQTAPGQDPRKAHSGAKVTTETNTGTEDERRKDDSERMHNAYDPKGIELGSFLLLPKVELDSAYNSNVFAQNSGAKSDFLTTLRPEFKLRSRFDEHMLNFSGMVEKVKYRRFDSDDQLNAQADIDARYDIGAATEANAFLQGYARHEDRGSPDEAGGTKPTPTKGLTLRSNVKHRFGKYAVVGGIDADRRVFENVPGASNSVIRNEDRDRWEVAGRLRGSYEMFPGYAAVSEVSANTRRYDSKSDRNGLDRDSYGYRAEAGIGVDISQLLRGDFLVGYFQQNYKDSRLKDPSGLSVRATFNWTPDKLTIVVPSLERSVSETITQGASSLVRTTGSVIVRHEAQRNLILTGIASVSRDEMEGVKGQDAWVYEGRMRATYAFTPELFVAGEAAYRRKDSELETSSYRQTLFFIRLGAQL